MSRRLEIELTSARDDGTWTWRAAGAREPKGVLDGGVLPAGAAVGQVLRVEAEVTLDGIDVTTVLPPKAEKAPRADTIQLLGSGRDEPLVTSTLVSRRGGEGRDREGRGRDRRDRPGRGERRDRDGDRPGRDRRRDGDRPGRGAARKDGRREGGDRERRPREDRAPTAKRLRAGRTHRAALLADLPEEQRPLAELVLRGGVPAVRQVVERQHALAQAEHQPRIQAEPLVRLAERLLPRLKAAEWHDRADAALRQIDEVDLRDLRSVVTASESAARDEQTRALADELRTALAARVEREHKEWLDELIVTLREGRIVRALRLSSRPPKAGAPLPAEVAAQLAEQATAGLTADVTSDRFATLLEAVSFSPVARRVAATSIPANPTPELQAMVKKVAGRVPAVAAQFAGAASAPTTS